MTTLFLLLSLSANAQELADSPGTQAEVATRNKLTDLKQPNGVIGPAPVYKDFMGITLGMEADEVREKLNNLKDEGEHQDFFVFSESLSAQVFYDQGKVNAISIDYDVKSGEAPSPESVLGEAVQAKPDGSIYQLKRYPAAGYWVAYSRTAGENPIVTITMQKI